MRLVSLKGILKTADRPGFGGLSIGACAWGRAAWPLPELFNAGAGELRGPNQPQRPGRRADLPNKICRLRNLANPVFPGLGTETYWIQLMAQFNCSKIVVNVSNESVKTNGGLKERSTISSGEKMLKPLIPPKIILPSKVL